MTSDCTTVRLGECLRLAKSNIKGANTRTDWLAFILYGDPHVLPAELFPTLAQAETDRDPEALFSGQPADPQSTGS